MPDIIYKKAGHIELVRYRDLKRFMAVGVVQSLIPTMTNKETELEDGNSDWPHTYSDGKSGGVRVNLNSFVPHIYAALTSMAQDEGIMDLRRIDRYSVPESAPYTVDVGKTIGAGTLVVHDTADSPFVSGGAGAGSFGYNGSEVTFTSADAGNDVIIAFDFEGNGERTTLERQTNTDIYRLTIAGEAILQKDEGTAKADTMIIDRVAPFGEISSPPRQKTPAGWNFNLKVLPPRPGYKVVDYRVEK